MIISHRYKFCFFAIPRTASQALGKHLVEHYEGERLFNMHISLQEFAQRTNGEFEDYSSFTIIRNPLDSVVSSYYKKKNDHNGRFSRGFFSNGKPIGVDAMLKYKFIVEKNASFESYFLRFHNMEYTIPRHEDTVDKVDHILKFESLQSDFRQLCSKLKIHFLPIPYFNKTDEKTKNWTQEYTPPTRTVAIKAFERLMKKWDYTFPTEWD